MTLESNSVPEAGIVQEIRVECPHPMLWAAR